MIAAGTLDDRVAILTPGVTRDAQFGEQRRTYTEAKTVSASVKFQSGKEVITAGEVWLSKVVAVTMRDNSLLTERCRIKWDGKTYRIKSLNRDKREARMVVICEYIDEENGV